MSEPGYQEALQRISVCVEEGADDLDLSRLDLLQVPPEVWQLTNLRELHLFRNQLAAIPAKLQQLAHLQTLNLSRNRLEAIPAELGRLANLQRLYLSGNQLVALPAELGRLSSLEQLYLQENQLVALPAELGRLSSLQELYLHENQLTTIPDEMGQLSNLHTLYLHENQLAAIPSDIGKLANLRTLYVHDNQLEAIPAELGQLANLQTLSLHSNQLAAIPAGLGHLANLKAISLHNNRLAAIPAELGKLASLRALSLQDNQLRAIPAELGRLANLQTLSLQDNQLRAIPAELGQLANLQTLSLQDNQLAAIPAELGQLVNLDLSGNQLAAIPAELGRLADWRTLNLSPNRLDNFPEPREIRWALTAFYLHGNSALGLPRELLGPTAEEVGLNNLSPANPAEILEYDARTKANGRPLNEAKLILVGKGAVGKSSLVEKLIHGTFVHGKAKTEGINIERWELPLGGDPVRLNVWDFGGQEIMHATHQFFLTERSLYLLVLNGREGKEDLEAEYWLKLIASFGAESPVIVVLNKIREHAFDLNRSALLRKYPNIKGFVRTECSDDTGIEELKTLICQETDSLDELRVKFPGEWFSVKDLLATTKENYLSFDRYRELCGEHEITNSRHQEMLARYLNQLGIVLNYRDDPRLKDTHVLNPHWVTNGIYKILNSPLLEANHGEIELKDIAEILAPSDYPMHMCRFIFDLMKKFDLCYSYPGDDCHYLIPELLPKNEPEQGSEFDLAECLNFQYQYPVLPEGLLPRFITRTYHLSLKEPHWRSGVILNFENARALVKADATERRVFISVNGDSAESRRRLLAVIRSDFERIHQDIKNLNPLEFIPLPGLPDQTVPYQDLVVMEQKGMKEFPKVIGAEIMNYHVTDLLSGVDLPRRAETEFKTWNLFYSYAHLDESYLKELKTHLSILRRQGIIQGWADREIEAGEEWRKTITYQLESADIILLLISANFIDSDFCYDVEMKRAIQRHKKGEARVIPVIVRDCNWKGAPFSELQMVPKDGKAVDTWENRDSAWRNVSEEIEKAADSLRKKSR
jgi:internalin A